MSVLGLGRDDSHHPPYPTAPQIFQKSNIWGWYYCCRAFQKLVRSLGKRFGPSNGKRGLERLLEKTLDLFLEHVFWANMLLGSLKIETYWGGPFPIFLVLESYQDSTIVKCMFLTNMGEADRFGSTQSSKLFRENQ